ncbi:D-2-hydroxyacid dehydrogenase [Mitsuokella sp.]|uniref:D-2-hydroxyacid dehydrogenase n=1 Tax=unclassified Mitsuokella TaxID=2637239 RepID=UPI003D7C7E2A
MNIAVVNSFMNDAHREKIRQAAAEHQINVAFYTSNEEALPHMADVDIIYAAATGGGHKLALAAPHLKWFCSVSAGVDPVLKPGVLPEGCLLSNSSGAYGVTIAEHLVMVTLMLLRRYPEYDEMIRRHEWRNDLPLRSIKGSRITIVGTGDLGTRYAERIQSFQPAAIIGVSRTGRKRSPVYDEVVKQDELETYLPKTDILVLCLPGTKETNNMISRERLALLPKDAFVINVGRGNSLDQNALVEALNADKLAGAALDVMVKEPIPEGDPLWTAKNVILTPHCSGKMTLAYTRDKTVAMFCEDLEHFVKQEPLAHEVKRSLGY